MSALDDGGRITDEGRALRALPLPPRLARMVVDAARENAGELAADIAVHRDRARAWRQRCRCHASASISFGAIARERDEGAAEWRSVGRKKPATAAATDGDASVGAIFSLAYPDRVAKNRGGGQGGFLLANGRGATLDPALSLAREPFIVAAELSGTRRAGAHSARGTDLAP